MRIFVTGATGFLGRFLVQRLIDQGDEVVALVRRANHNLPKNIQVVYGDIVFPDSWSDAGLGCERIYHLAALVSFDPRQKKQLLLVNGYGTSNVITAALRWNIESSVVVSSACTMGLSYCKEVLLNENSSIDQKNIKSNPYLESKLESEKFALSISASHRVVIVNPTTIYGPGDWTLNSGTLIKKIATSHILPVPPGGSNVVDVEDVVEGILLAAERGISGSRYIIGGQNMSFKDIFIEVSTTIGKKPIFIFLPSLLRRPLSLAACLEGRFIDRRFFTTQIVDDMFYFKYYSIKFAEEELGFKPRFSFQESIKRAWAFYKKNGLIK